MRNDEGRTIGLYFKVSPEEMETIKEKMELAGTANKRAYLRKMAVDGYIVRVDFGDLKGLLKLMASISNNINQIARRVNGTGNLYAEDMEDMKNGCMEARLGIAELVKKLKGI